MEKFAENALKYLESQIPLSLLALYIKWKDLYENDMADIFFDKITDTFMSYHLTDIEKHDLEIIKASGFCDALVCVWDFCLWRNRVIRLEKELEIESGEELAAKNYKGVAQTGNVDL